MAFAIRTTSSSKSQPISLEPPHLSLGRTFFLDRRENLGYKGQWHPKFKQLHREGSNQDYLLIIFQRSCSRKLLISRNTNRN